MLKKIICMIISLFFVTLASVNIYVYAAEVTVDNTLNKNSEKVKDIKKLFEYTGGSKMVKQIMGQVPIMVKKEYPDADEKLLKDLLADFKIDELLEQMVPIYDKYFTHEDIKELIRFYESPIGKKMIDVMPQMMQDMIPISMNWVKSYNEKTIKKLQETHKKNEQKDDKSKDKKDNKKK